MVFALCLQAIKNEAVGLEYELGLRCDLDCGRTHNS